jgi:hypothetical protein
MLHAAEHYENMSEEALKAADRAATVDERLRHREKAHEYAKMACAERERTNVYAFSSHRR